MAPRVGTDARGCGRVLVVLPETADARGCGSDDDVAVEVARWGTAAAVACVAGFAVAGVAVGVADVVVPLRRDALEPGPLELRRGGGPTIFTLVGEGGRSKGFPILSEGCWRGGMCVISKRAKQSTKQMLENVYVDVCVSVSV